MSKQIIFSEDEYETRAALLEDEALAEIFSENKDSESILGNIYKGRVNSVLPGMQVAFVDIGLERNAFLHISDLHSEFNEFGEWVRRDKAKAKTKSESNVARRGRQRIGDILKKGQEILVQIDKEPIGTKGPRVTAYITLPGRYLVFMPTVENIGISRRIEADKEREAIREKLRFKTTKTQKAITIKGIDEILNKYIDFLIKEFQLMKEKLFLNLENLRLGGNRPSLEKAIDMIFEQGLDNAV